MSIPTWDSLAKNLTDPEKIEEAVVRLIGVHEADEASHLGVGESLQSHKASEIIDHVAGSVVNDKIAVDSRIYTAVVKVPLTDPVVYYPKSITDSVGSWLPSIGGQTMLDVFRNPLPHDDSNYIYTSTPAFGENYFDLDFDDIPVDKKIYKIIFHVRAKILNAGAGTPYCEFAFGENGDFFTEEFAPTTSWADFTFEQYLSPYNSYTYDPAVLLDCLFGINYQNNNVDPAVNSLAISQFYAEVFCVSDIDYSDYFFLKDAVEYVKSLGGGNVFIKDGLYHCGASQIYLDKNIHIIGQSKSGVILDTDPNDFMLGFSDGNANVYSVGTITLTQGSSNVLGSGTTWTLANTVGHYLLDRESGHFFLIIAFVDSTNITISEVYQGKTLSGRSYKISHLNTECSISNLTVGGCIDFYASLNCKVDNVRFENAEIYFDTCENLIIENSEFYGCVFDQTSPDINNSFIFNNAFSNTLLNILNFDSSCKYNVFEKNLFINNKQQCLIVKGKNNIILNNTVLNSGWSLSNIYPPILLYASSLQNIISNNVVKNCQSWGIAEQDGADYNIYSSNVVVSNGSSGINIRGANSLDNSNII